MIRLGNNHQTLKMSKNKQQKCSVPISSDVFEGHIEDVLLKIMEFKYRYGPGTIVYNCGHWLYRYTEKT